MTLSRMLFWLITGSDRASISATAWDRRERPFWGQVRRLIDALSEEGHCEAAARYHAERRVREYRLDREVK